MAKAVRDHLGAPWVSLEPDGWTGRVWLPASPLPCAVGVLPCVVRGGWLRDLVSGCWVDLATKPTELVPVVP